MQKELLIVFSKSPILGKVKTRLAVEVGEKAALAIHSKLFEMTVNAVNQSGKPYQIYLAESDPSRTIPKYKIQEGNHLGVRMMKAISTEITRNHMYAS